MKKLLALVLALASIMALMCACNKKEENSTETTKSGSELLEEAIEKYNMDDKGQETVNTFLKATDEAFDTLGGYKSIGDTELAEYANAVDAAYDKFREDFEPYMGDDLEWNDDLLMLNMTATSLSFDLTLYNYDPSSTDKTAEGLAEAAVDIVVEFSVIFTGEACITEEDMDAIGEKM